MADKKKANKPTAREQGVPEVYLNKDTGTFRIGMDARLKSDLVNAALGIESKDALHEFSELAAVKLIKARGWESFLNRKRQIIADRERKSQERQAQKEAAARERADAKAQKDAEKKEAAAAKKAANTTTNVTPDPKAKAKTGSKK
jgi:FKBP-type peptidyl-prolyl cis-trans isomerase